MILKHHIGFHLTDTEFRCPFDGDTFGPFVGGDMFFVGHRILVGTFDGDITLASSDAKHMLVSI